ncbi:MAG: DNA methyltransferase, partial [bacterium]
MSWKVLQGDVLDKLAEIKDGTIQCCVTSPPYWGLRDYGIDGQIGLEESPDKYVAKMVQVFREVKRVLRDDGTVFLNLGDCYFGSSMTGGTNSMEGSAKRKGRMFEKPSNCTINQGKIQLKTKDLVGIPWRVAFALQADGWYLRSDIIWCLSGGTWVYARTQKGDMPMTIKDMARLDPKTVQLWNGSQWTQLLGMSRSHRQGDEIELVLRSGERVSCTPTHKFPTTQGLKEASNIGVGDILIRTNLPEPESPLDCVIDEDAAWFAGLYVAEGSRSNNCIQIACHVKEEHLWRHVQEVAKKYGGTATRTVDGNCMNIRVYGKILNALLDELVTGKIAKDKGFSPKVWRYSNRFLDSMLQGYLDGDGHWDEKNNRWRIGFTRNYNLERDLRAACARLGYRLTLNMSSVPYNGKGVPTFRGEIRKTVSAHHNSKDTCEVVEIRKARCRDVYDIG